MARSLLALAALGILAAGPALAQLENIPQTAELTQGQLAPVRNVLADAQQRLRQMGYEVTPNGQPDHQTREATARFQADHGLRPTGQLDLSTLAMLGINVDTTGASTAQLPPEPAH